MAVHHFPRIGYGLITAFAGVILAGIVLGPAVSGAHPGYTNAFGCHVCTDREECERWGVAVGQYHCHNDGKSMNAPNDVKPLELHEAAPSMWSRRADRPLSRRAQRLLQLQAERRRAEAASSSSAAAAAAQAASSRPSPYGPNADRDAAAYDLLSSRYHSALVALRAIAEKQRPPVRADLELALDYYAEALDDFDSYVRAARERPLSATETRAVIGLLGTVDRSLRVFNQLHGSR